MLLVIGNKNYSSWSLRPWLAMKVLGLAFEEQCVALYTPQAKAELLRHSPAGKAPILIDGATVVWDSLAIGEYLAERHPAMWPDDRVARAHARSIVAEMHSGFAALRSEMSMCIRERVDVRPWSPRLSHDVERIARIFDESRRRFGQEGDYLFGRYSIADCFFAPVAFRFQTYAVALPDPSGEYVRSLLAHSDVRAWERDAVAETTIIEADEPRHIYRDKLAKH